MFSHLRHTKLKQATSGFVLIFLASWPALSFSAPEQKDINGENIHINTPQEKETLFNITNGGSLIVSGTEAGFLSRLLSHQLNDSTLSLESQAIFNGDIDSNNSHIIFSDSIYNGTIRAAASASVGDIYINATEFNGGIKSGTNNKNKTITIKDSVFNGQGIISPLAVYSGNIIVENTDFNNHNFPVIDIRNANSAIFQNIAVNSTSDYSGLRALGISGIFLQNSDTVDIMHSTITSEGTAVRMRNDASDGVLGNLFISSSTLTGKSAAALEAANSDIVIYETTLNTLSDGKDNACYAGSTAINGCGALNLENANVSISQHSSLNSSNAGVFITGEKQSRLDITNTAIHAQNAIFDINKGQAAITVRDFEAPLISTPSLISNKNILLEALNNSQVDFWLHNIYAVGDIYADDSSKVTAWLSGASRLTGDIFGIESLDISRNATWKMVSDNAINELMLTGGSVLMPDAGRDRPFHTLTVDTLSGTGLFGLNTNLQKMQGDLLNIRQGLSGSFLLRIANSGAEPENANALLKVVQAPASTAQFALYGGKVDAGVWQYDLVQKDNDWYLANTNRPDTPVPPDEPDAPDNGGGTVPQPQPSLTPSADAILNMAAAPVYIFNSELQNLRQRRGGEKGGVWGRYIHQNARINGGVSSWRLGQNGFELGGDKAVPVREGDLFVGLTASVTNNAVRDERGGNSQIDSYSFGAYSSWFADSGLYFDAVVKANRFNHRLYTRMSDGTAVNGGYSQYGLGGALEGGWHFALADEYWTEPFVRLSAFRAGGKSIALSNGMKAQIRQPSSLQAETGVQLGKRIQLEKATLNPYLKVSLAHDLVKTGKVRLNESWNFDQGATATTGRYGAGMAIRLTKDASLFTEIDYQKGRTFESPVTANLGFQIAF